MKVIEGIENINQEFENLCIALGTFDGIHFGHKEVILSAVKRAKEINGKAVVFTFSPHPLNIITSQNGPKLINSKEEKIFLLKELGVDAIIFANFTIEFSELHPEEFISRILINTLNAKELFVGFNYTFGKNGIGNTDYLSELSHKYNMQINVVPPVSIDNEVVSSTLIRSYISKGKFDEAEKLLGYKPIISGKVIRGKQYASELGFPTANLKIINKVYPPYGVYGVKVVIPDIGDHEYDGVMNIGVNPTLKPGEHSIEVHLLDFSEKLYSKNIIIKVLRFIRTEEKFNNKEELITKIEEDIQYWREWIRCH